MDVNKLKKKIEAKDILEDEINEQMILLGEKAKEILIKNDEIFNGSTIQPQIHKEKITFHLECNLDYSVLKELDDELQPNKIILVGSGTSGMWSGNPVREFIDIQLFFG